LLDVVCNIPSSFVSSIAYNTPEQY
jgi:hypothetical protein